MNERFEPGRIAIDCGEPIDNIINVAVGDLDALSASPRPFDDQPDTVARIFAKAHLNAIAGFPVDELLSHFIE